MTDKSAVDALPFPTTDAMKWVEAFRETFPDANVDDGTMLGWFANAIEHGRGPAKTPDPTTHRPFSAGYEAVAQGLAKTPDPATDEALAWFDGPHTDCSAERMHAHRLAASAKDEPVFRFDEANALRPARKTGD